MPKLKGGKVELGAIMSTLKLPLYAKQNNVFGTVEIEMSIDTTGNIATSKIVKRLGYGCDEEALRLIKFTSGKWNAAEMNGKKVEGKILIPIKFKRERDDLNERAKFFYKKGLKIYNRSCLKLT